MSETQKPRKNRGSYVKMKFLYHKNGENRTHDKKLFFFFKYYKYLIFISFSLSLYILTSCSIPYNHRLSSFSVYDTHRFPTISNSHLMISRALIDPINSETVQKKPSLPPSLKDVKIFVYDLPPKFNTDWLSNPRCSNHLFASEVAIHRALLTSHQRSFDPYDADLFFVPVYVSCNFSTVNGFPAIGHARSLLISAVHLISEEYPFWNRSRGSDHVFVASHDFGACFHTMEDVAIKDGIPEFLKKSIILQTFGVNYKHPCQEVEHVVIPPYVSPESVLFTVENSRANGQRDIFAFFRGKMEVNPKNVSGRFYSKRVRTEIWRKYNDDRRFYLKRQRFSGYQLEIVRSVFCLCPLGWAPWSPRLVESVELGCVPVIIADGIRLPFHDAVNWPEISLTVAEKDVGKLGEILEHVAATNLSTIQKNLWDPSIRRALLFNNQVQDGDSTWQVLRALAAKLERSYRRSRDENQSLSST